MVYFQKDVLFSISDQATKSVQGFVIGLLMRREEGNKLSVSKNSGNVLCGAAFGRSSPFCLFFWTSRERVFGCVRGGGLRR